METGAFNLNQAIKTHVDVLKSTGSLTNADATELTDHLHDATEALLKQQLTAEEAFIIASKRLGSAAVLNEEYSKVNTTMSINKIWAYMFIGFNVLFALPTILFQILAIIDVYIIYNTPISKVIITGLHLAICWGIIYAARQKKDMANFIEKQVEKSAVRAVAWSSVPFILIMVLKFIVFPNMHRKPMFISSTTFYNNPFGEISFFMVLLTFAFTIISLAVSVNKFEKFSLKSLFQKPGTLFLILVGLIVELLAASTRVIQLPYGTSSLIDGIFSSVLFGAIYMIPSLIITLYNQQNSWRYLILFSAIGFILEMSVGIAIDLESGTYRAAMYSSALVVSVLIGKIIGNVMRSKDVSVARS